MYLPPPIRYGVAIAAIAVTGASLAAPQATTGLGASWPNTTDLSTSSRYHVYRFERAGVQYVQVNDAAGTVRGAIAVAGDQVIDLPIGLDASHWVIGNGDPAAPAGEPVYHDETVTISIAPQSNGTARMMVAPGTCDDPAVCSKRDP